MTTHEKVWLAVAVFCTAVAVVQSERLTEAEASLAEARHSRAVDLDILTAECSSDLRSVVDVWREDRYRWKADYDSLRSTHCKYVLGGDPPIGPQGPPGVDPKISLPSYFVWADGGSTMIGPH